MAAKISQRYLIDSLSDPKAFASVAVGALLTAYVIDMVFHPIIARLASDWQKLAIQVSKFAFLACCLFATYPYSPLSLTALAVAAVVITIHQATPSKGAAEKEIPTKEAKPVQTAIVTGKASLDSCPEAAAVRHILEFVKPDETFLIPEEVKTYFDPLKVAKPGQASIVTGNANLHFDTLSLFVQQQFPDYQVVYLKKNPLSAEEADRLSNFLRQRPKTVLMTASTHVIHSLLPEESYVLGFFTEDPLSAFTLDLTRIKLGDMTAQISGQLMIHWLKSKSFMLEHPGMAFEDQRVKTIESILRLICENTNVVYYRDAIWNQFAGYIKATSSLSELKDDEQLLPPFFAYARQVLGIVPSVLISVAQAMREKMNIHFSYCPQHVIIKPTYLVRLSKHALSQARTGHQEQLLSGLGGVEKRHAFVSGCPSADLKRLLQGAIGEDLFEWKIEDMVAIDKSKLQASINDFIDYLWARPKTVLYISSVIQLQLLGYRDLKFFLDHFPPETRIVCANVSRKMEGDLLRLFLEQAKQVRLTPLLEKECQQAVNEWIRTHYKDIKFKERAVEAAVKMAFLLLEEEREKLSFIEDLVERTIRSPSSQETPITTVHLWNTFTTLYPEEKRRIEIAAAQDQYLQPTLSSLSHVGGVKSLNTIALAIKAEFKVDLPLQAEAPHEMPFFLVNLNEQMREKPQFAVGNERRIAELANGLKGLNKKNALLVGAPGVGKTTLVESIAWMLEKGQIDQSLPLYGKTIYSLDTTEMTKGIRYIGTFEERVSQLIGFLKNDKTAVLFIDEIQLILGAGVSLGNPMGSLAQKLKPYLTQEWMSVIGATTPGEEKKWMTGDESAAFLRRFKEIKISEPTVEECQKILLYITRSDKFKDIYPGVTFDEAAIGKAIALTNENPTKVGQPDRSKDLLEKAASAVLNNENKHVTVEVVEAASKQVAESVAL